MNNHQQYLRIKKLKGRGIIRVAAKHNLREIQSELGANSHIDASLMNTNVVLFGPTTACEVSDSANRLISESGIDKLRKDAVRGLEIIVSLPAYSAIDRNLFFIDSLEWVNDFFRVRVLSAVIHNDEAAPHCHFLLLPLVAGKMQGSDIAGNRKRLQDMQASFYAKVGALHGLVRPKPPKRLSTLVRSKSASLILTALQSQSELLDRQDVEAALLTTIGRDPEQLLSVLGLAVPFDVKQKKSFAEIMTKPCPEKHIGFAGRSKPIGFIPEQVKREQTLSCVGFSPMNPVIQRVHDDEQPSGYWNEDLGEFVSAVSNVTVQRCAA